ncbi:MAG: hypothetical protein E7294_09125 [Lachnospiraceae bacterium]|jgi:hypothetical protein|nr:hypothetical protein [Lachnospiraceae bacterium]
MYKKMKKVLAIVLATTMVMGSSVLASATETTSGSAIGEGTNEGHVDTHIVKCTLPTSAVDTFNYRMDPERLIQVTSGAAIASSGSLTLPTPVESDTGVYFLTEATGGAVTYANTSKALKVTNTGTADVKLKVEVTATTTAGAVTLVDSKDKAAGETTNAALYLGLQIVSGSSIETEEAVKVGTISKTVTIKGTPSNYHTVVSGGAYQHVISGEAVGLSWSAMDFQLTGAVSKASAKDLTAPKLEITWSYEDAEDAEDEAEAEEGIVATPAKFDSNTTSAVLSNIPEGASLTTVKFVKADNSLASLTEGTHWSYVSSTKTFTVLKPALNGLSGSKWVLEFGEGNTIEIPVE